MLKTDNNSSSEILELLNHAVGNINSSSELHPQRNGKRSLQRAWISNKKKFRRLIAQDETLRDDLIRLYETGPLGTDENILSEDLHEYLSKLDLKESQVEKSHPTPEADKPESNLSSEYKDKSPVDWDTVWGLAIGFAMIALFLGAFSLWTNVVFVLYFAGIFIVLAVIVLLWPVVRSVFKRL